MDDRIANASERVASPLPRVAAVLVLRADGAALLQHRDDKPGLRHAAMWTPPGGHCNPGEASAACARRELHEETSYRCGQLHFLTSLLDEPGRGWQAYQLDVYWTAYDGRQPVQCHEGQALEFVPRQDAQSLPMPHYIPRLWDEALQAFAFARLKETVA